MFRLFGLTKVLKLRCEIPIQYEKRVCYEITYENVTTL